MARDTNLSPDFSASGDMESQLTPQMVPLRRKQSFRTLILMILGMAVVGDRFSSKEQAEIFADIRTAVHEATDMTGMMEFPRKPGAARSREPRICLRLRHWRYSRDAVADRHHRIRRSHGITRRRAMAVNQRLRPQSFA
jgi:hypothetical protein